MDRLEIEEKKRGSKFTSGECNSMIYKINEVVDALNGSSTVQRKIYIQNNLDGKSIAAQNGEPCVLDFVFVSQERYDYDSEYENTGERGLCQISIKNAEHSEYTIVKQYYINSNVSVKLDVAEWLTSGANSIMIKVTGEVTEVTTPAYTYTVQLTTLSLSSPNFRWWQAFAGNITVPFLIGGNISKKLFVTLTGTDNEYTASYTVNLGNATYTETAYNYIIPHPDKTGVFRVKAYVTNSDETLQTRSVEFEIMCTVASDMRKLMCVNNVAGSAVNWTENTLFEYAISDGDATSAEATFTVKRENDIEYKSVEDSISTNTKHAFSFPMEVETDDDSDFEITVSVQNSDESKLTSDLTFMVENSLGYSAISGAVFYMNPQTRSNNQANSLDIINEVNSSAISAVWKGMNRISDGWIADEEGTRVLRILAGSSVEIDYKPFEKEAARTGKAIEIDFKTYNVVDGTKAVISMLTPSGDSYTGYRIAPEEITMFSQSKRDGTTQHLPIDTGVRIRATMVLMPDAYGNSGFNLATIYINGRKNREFNYESNDYFAQNGKIVIGSEQSDIDIYGIRIYDNALTSEGVQKNYINRLSNNADKDAEKEANNILDSTASFIDFQNTKKKYNVFVFDKPFPKKSDPSGRTGTVEFFFADKPEMNCSVTNVLAEGQGTSSKLYYEWNQRYKLDKNLSVITYADGTTSTKKVKLFNGVPPMDRITAKKNFASSMQDHKAGAVNSYNDISKKMGLTNEAIAANPEVRVAVYQEPFIGFSKELNDEGELVYTCWGEFTLGPDKGAKDCFGYDTDKFPNLISIEGADNAPLPALFRVPWNTNKPYFVYNEEEEAFQYNGANAWDFSAGKVENIKYWIPAYNIAYRCSNRILPFAGTLDELNAQVVNYRSTGYEYWIAKEGDVNRYNLYYYEAAEGKFIPSDIGNGTINLYLQLVGEGYGLNESDLSGKTSEQQNSLFIVARIAKFRKEASQFWDIDDSLFHACFIEFKAGTDNRAKNTYPYCFDPVTGKWKWRQDDLDTILPIDNQGQDKKPYSCEVHDTYENGAPVWNGETSNFWNLLELAFSDEMAITMRKMLAAMESLSGQSYGTSYDKLYAYYKKYYLSVKEYFPSTMVNADSKIYENAKLAYMAGTYSNDTDPITQLHGDFYSTETAWMKKRILYMMSKYSYGTFSADGTDTITVRAAGDEIIYDLIPAMDLYPAIANGTSIIRGERTKAGETCRMIIDLGGSADQQNNIQGASYLLSIGDWHNKNVSGTMIVQGRRLQEIILGSKTRNVIITITGLTISNCPSVKKILLSNITTLAGVLDVSACIHLKEIYADGTSLAQMKLPEGGGLELVEYSAYNAYLILRNFPMLRAENVKIDLCKEVITDFLVQDCPLLAPIKLLTDIMDAQANQGTNHALKRVRAVGFDETYNTSDMLDKLAQLADGSYIGLNSEGLAGEDEIPVLDGKLTVNASAYEDSVEALRNTFSKLILNVTGAYYIRFEDDEVRRICAENWGDGTGITKEQAEAVTTLGSLFRDNTKIRFFNELRYFINVKNYTSTFWGCRNLEKVILPENTTHVNYSAFRDTAIKSIIIPGNVVELYSEVFSGCVNLEKVIIREGNVTEFITGRNYLFAYTKIKELVLPSRTTRIDNYFTRGSIIERIYIRATMPPPLASGYGDDYHLKDLYVPIGCLEVYRNADNWKNFKTITEYDFDENPHGVE